jgi:uncharacterized protein (TIGR03435 family)
MSLAPPPPGANAAANPFAGLPTVFAVVNTLGLELRRQSDTVDFYVVEHVERPTL